MKRNLLLLSALITLLLPSCETHDAKTITICCDESPHGRILTNAIQPLLKKAGYTLVIQNEEWDCQNDEVKKGTYDFNFFQHRSFLQEYETGKATFDPDYTYKSVFPVASVHYEPLRVYYGKGSVDDFEATKKTATYLICSDATNESRALDFLQSIGAIDSYETDGNHVPIHVPDNIHTLPENELVSQKNNYDYAIIPCSTAFDAQLVADPGLPVESLDTAMTRVNIVAGNVRSYKKSKEYRLKAEALAQAVTDSSVTTYIQKTWNGFVLPEQKSYLGEEDIHI